MVRGNVADIVGLGSLNRLSYLMFYARVVATLQGRGRFLCDRYVFCAKYLRLAQRISFAAAPLLSSHAFDIAVTVRSR